MAQGLTYEMAMAPSTTDQQWARSYGEVFNAQWCDIPVDKQSTATRKLA